MAIFIGQQALKCLSWKSNTLKVDSGSGFLDRHLESRGGAVCSAYLFFDHVSSILHLALKFTRPIKSLKHTKQIRFVIADIFESQSQLFWRRVSKVI